MASNSDDILRLLKQISDNSEAMHSDLIRLDKKVDLHIQKTELELERIKETDDVQNQLLDEHIAGVNTLKDMLKQHEKDDIERFHKIDEPRRFIMIILKIIAVVGTIAGTVAAVTKLFE